MGALDQEHPDALSVHEVLVSSYARAGRHADAIKLTAVAVLRQWKRRRR